MLGTQAPLSRSSRPSRPHGNTWIRGTSPGSRPRTTMITARPTRLLRVARIVDPEHAGIGPLGAVQIGNGDRRVIALRIRHRPLLPLIILGTDHHHQPAGADERLPLFDDNGHKEILRAN